MSCELMIRTYDWVIYAVKVLSVVRCTPLTAYGTLPKFVNNDTALLRLKNSWRLKAKHKSNHTCASCNNEIEKNKIRKNQKKKKKKRKAKNVEQKNNQMMRMTEEIKSTSFCIVRATTHILREWLNVLSKRLLSRPLLYPAYLILALLLPSLLLLLPHVSLSLIHALPKDFASIRPKPPPVGGISVRFFGEILVHAF